jgi:hypothetical protein
MFYGYCHETRRMRMMDYSDFTRNVQTGVSNLYSNPASITQPIVDALSSIMRGQSSTTQDRGRHRHDYNCGCHKPDCSCDCCIRCADIVEYARCGELRRIPITFDNDTRRERDVTLELGNFVTESGQPVGWNASLSTTQFKLPVCGEVTVQLEVNIDCSKVGRVTNANEDRQRDDVDRCEVAYATIRAEGCTIRPIVVAVAVLPQHCASHHAGCGCGCCN